MIKLVENIANITTGTLGTANTSYTYFNLAAENYRYFSLQFVILATTLTLEGSNDPTTVSNADATWRDVTTTLTGAATAVATGIWIIRTACPIARLRVKRVTTNATNSLKLNLCKTS